MQPTDMIDIRFKTRPVGKATDPRIKSENNDILQKHGFLIFSYRFSIFKLVERVSRSEWNHFRNSKFPDRLVEPIAIAFWFLSFQAGFLRLDDLFLDCQVTGQIISTWMRQVCDFHIYTNMFWNWMNDFVFGRSLNKGLQIHLNRFI